MRFKKQVPKRLSLDMTPLIDVIFLLLIFFMVSTTFITSPGIHVNLPKASVTKKIDRPETIELVISADNKIYVNGSETSRRALRGSLSAIYKKTRFEKLIIRADGDVKHETVVYAMDMAKQVGIHKLAIATQLNNKK